MTVYLTHFCIAVTTSPLNNKALVTQRVSVEPEDLLAPNLVDGLDGRHRIFLHCVHSRL